MNFLKPISIAEGFFRSISASRRCLPDFIIIGGQKCGTGSLFKYLVQHPQILPSFKKEVHYFDLNFNKGINWYRKHFPLLSQKSSSQITGEASPYYLFHPLAAARIAKALPHVKIIALLRNPSDRAVSHYHMEKRKGREALSMEEAFEAEKKRVEQEYHHLETGEISYSFNCHRFTYKKRGLYLEQLERYERLFPQNQMLVLSSEDFFTDTLKTLRKVFSFLEVDLNFTPGNLAPKGTGGYNKTHTLPVYHRLKSYFAPHNKKLFEKYGVGRNW